MRATAIVLMLCGLSLMLWRAGFTAWALHEYTTSSVLGWALVVGSASLPGVALALVGAGLLTVSKARLTRRGDHAYPPRNLNQPGKEG